MEKEEKTDMKNLLLCFIAFCALSACGRNIFSKYAPDEFAVESRAPLTLPPNFDLRAPVNETSHDHQQAQIRAQKAHGAEVNTAEKTQELSAGDRALLSKTGGDQVDDSIRDEVDRETAQIKKEGKKPKVGEVTGKKIAAPDEAAYVTDHDGKIVE